MLCAQVSVTDPWDPRLWEGDGETGQTGWGNRLSPNSDSGGLGRPGAALEEGLTLKDAALQRRRLLKGPTRGSLPATLSAVRAAALQQEGAG